MKILETNLTKYFLVSGLIYLVELGCISIISSMSEEIYLYNFLIRIASEIIKIKLVLYLEIFTKNNYFYVLYFSMCFLGPTISTSFFWLIDSYSEFALLTSKITADITVSILSYQVIKLGNHPKNT